MEGQNRRCDTKTDAVGLNIQHILLRNQTQQNETIIPIRGNLKQSYIPLKNGDSTFIAQNLEQNRSSPIEISCIQEHFKEISSMVLIHTRT